MKRAIRFSRHSGGLSRDEPLHYFSFSVRSYQRVASQLPLLAMAIQLDRRMLVEGANGGGIAAPPSLFPSFSKTPVFFSKLFQTKLWRFCGISRGYKGSKRARAQPVEITHSGEGISESAPPLSLPRSYGEGRSTVNPEGKFSVSQALKSLEIAKESRSRRRGFPLPVLTLQYAHICDRCGSPPRRRFSLGVAGLSSGSAWSQEAADASTVKTPVSFAVPEGAADCEVHVIADPATFPFWPG